MRCLSVAPATAQLAPVQPAVQEQMPSVQKPWALQASGQVRSEQSSPVKPDLHLRVGGCQGYRVVADKKGEENKGTDSS